MKCRESLEQLTWILDDDDSEVGRSVALALAKAGSVELLIESLKSPSHRVRYAAASAIGTTQDRRVIKPLISSLNDGDPSVRRAAADSLSKFREPEVVNAIVEALNDADSVVCHNAVKALAGC